MAVRGGNQNVTTQVVAIFEEFKAAVEAFQQVTYDIMHVEEKQFDDDFFQFRCAVKELDRRLATVLSNSFDDLDSMPQRLKLLDNFEGLLERPILQDELERKSRKTACRGSVGINVVSRRVPRSSCAAIFAANPPQRQPGVSRSV